MVLLNCSVEKKHNFYLDNLVSVVYIKYHLLRAGYFIINYEKTYYT